MVKRKINVNVPENSQRQMHPPKHNFRTNHSKYSTESSGKSILHQVHFDASKWVCVIHKQKAAASIFSRISLPFHLRCAWVCVEIDSLPIECLSIYINSTSKCFRNFFCSRRCLLGFKDYFREISHFFLSLSEFSVYYILLFELQFNAKNYIFAISIKYPYRVGGFESRRLW